jgi:hypothetical protein
MEVFTALYDSSLKEIEPPHALVIDEKVFSRTIINHPMIFSGSGHQKLKDSLLHASASFSPYPA